MQELIGRLDSESFAERQEASAALEKLAAEAADSLRGALERTRSAEVRNSLRQILQRTNASAPPTPELLRSVRAVEALEWAGTPEAPQHLEKLAAGAAGAPLTREAAGALLRLRKAK